MWNNHIAQMVEHQLTKLGVTGSIPVMDTLTIKKLKVETTILLCSMFTDENRKLRQTHYQPDGGRDIVRAPFHTALSLGNGCYLEADQIYPVLVEIGKIAKEMAK